MNGERGANLGDRFLDATATTPDGEAVVVAGDDAVRLTYAQLADRVWRLAAVLRARGVRPDDRVAILLGNGNEHLEVLLASFLLRAVPVNLSSRASRDEVRSILGASRASFVVHEPDIERPHPEALARGDDYEHALAGAGARPDVPGRSGDDHYLLYTGGTTGRPKGVLWRHSDLFRAALSAAGAVRCLPASPFAHGTGQWIALATLLHRGTIVCRRERSLDPEALLDTAEAEAASFLVVVGDAFARPLVDVIGACPGRWSLGSLTTILSGGALLSPAVKAALLELLPTVLVVDGFGASETGGQGRMISVAGAVATGLPRFAVDQDTTVLDDDLRPLPAGDGRTGWLARRGPIPLGYDGDAEATATAFPTVDGVRWAISGDRARLESDGTVTVIGRGATTINTGGHKVQPEEVEQCLRSHPAVYDAVVIGIPDERFGERIAAVVSARHDARPTLESLRRHCDRQLADYKLPRHLVLVSEVRRSPAGKPDYLWAMEVASG